MDHVWRNGASHQPRGTLKPVEAICLICQFEYRTVYAVGRNGALAHVALVVAEEWQEMTAAGFGDQKRMDLSP